MQYVLFGGVFCLPVVVCLGLLATRILDRFRPEEVPANRRTGEGRLEDFNSRESELAESFFHSPVETQLPH